MPIGALSSAYRSQEARLASRAGASAMAGAPPQAVTAASRRPWGDPDERQLEVKNMPEFLTDKDGRAKTSSEAEPTSRARRGPRVQSIRWDRGSDGVPLIVVPGRTDMPKQRRSRLGGRNLWDGDRSRLGVATSVHETRPRDGRRDTRRTRPISRRCFRGSRRSSSAGQLLSTADGGREPCRARCGLE